LRIKSSTTSNLETAFETTFSSSFGGIISSSVKRNSFARIIYDDNTRIIKNKLLLVVATSLSKSSISS